MAAPAAAADDTAAADDDDAEDDATDKGDAAAVAAPAPPCAPPSPPSGVCTVIHSKYTASSCTWCGPNRGTAASLFRSKGPCFCWCCALQTGWFEAELSVLLLLLPFPAAAATDGDDDDDEDDDDDDDANISTSIGRPAIRSSWRRLRRRHRSTSRYWARLDSTGLS